MNFTNYRYITDIKDPIPTEELQNKEFIGIYSPRKSSEKNTDELSENDQTRLATRLAVASKVEELLMGGKYIITDVNSYDVCTAIIRTLRTLSEDKNTSEIMGRAVVIAEEKTLSRSGLEKLLAFTPNCTIVSTMVSPTEVVPEAVTKAHTEEAKAYTALKKEVVERNKDKKDEDKEELPANTVLPLLAAKDVAERISWKYIMEMCNEVFLFTESPTTIFTKFGVPNQIIRDSINNSTRLFVGVTDGKPKLLEDMNSLDKIATDVKFYENSNECKLDCSILAELLRGNSPKEKLKKTLFIEELNKKKLSTLTPKDRVTVLGADFKCIKENLTCIQTSVLEGTSINFTEATPTELVNFINQIGNILDASFTSGKTIFSVVNSQSGVSVLRSAYYYFYSHPDTKGRLVVYLGDYTESKEREEIEAFIPALLDTGKVRVVEGSFLPRTIITPNPKPKEEREENESDTIKHNVTDIHIGSLITETLCSKILMINANLPTSDKLSATVLFREADQKTCEYYNYEPELDIFKVAKVSKAKEGWRNLIPKEFDLTEISNAIYGTAENVKGW